MSVTTIEDFSSLIGNFNNNTSESTSTLKWKMLFSDSSYGISNGNSIIQNPNVFGNALSYDNGLKLFGSNKQVKSSTGVEYDIPGKTSIELISPLSNSYEFNVKISSFGPTTDHYMRTFDTIDNVESTYDNEELFVGLGGVDGYEFGIVILKPPSRLKIKNASRYVNEILKRGAIGDSTIFDIDGMCDDEMFTENQRILTTVYRKNGEYYVDNFDDGKVYPNYSLIGGLFKYKYSGSGNIKPLNLINIGTDGRVIKNVNKYAIDNTYISSRVKGGELLNDFMYPSKLNSTVIDVYDVTDNTPLIISGKVVFQSGYWQSILWVSCGGINYNTQRLFTNNSNILLPKISLVDFSTEYSVKISSVTVEDNIDYQDVGDITSSMKKCIEPHIELYVSAWPTNTIPNETTVSNAISNGRLVSGDSLVIGEGERVFYKILSYTPKSILRYAYTKDSQSAGGGANYDVPYLSDILRGTDTLYGKYVISSYSEGNSDTSEYEVSATISRVFNVYKKVENPTCTISLVTSNGGNSHINEYVFGHIDKLPIYFTVNGEDVSIDGEHAISEYWTANSKYTSGYFDTECVIKFKAIDVDNALMSEQVEITYTPATMNKLPAPQVSYYNGVVTMSSQFNASVYYTIDGSTPYEGNWLKYEVPVNISPIKNWVRVNAISVKEGMISSDLSSLGVQSTYSCAPWTLEYGYAPKISDGYVDIVAPSQMTRLGSFNEYVMDFDILLTNGPFNLIITQRDAMLNTNDYSNSMFNNICYYVGCTYDDGLLSRMHLGSQSNVWDSSGFNNYAKFTRRQSDKLHVKYEVKIIDSLYSHRMSLTTANGEYYTTGWSYAGIESISAPSIVCNSIISAKCGVRLSNINLTCN